ncbi:MAG TPA: ATPase inhibitor subunit zeta [Stellaceae bacterium]|nr:ATPase inhibitor subunit zeta [Stellaceae bacterium]
MSIFCGGKTDLKPERESKLIAHRNKLLGLWAAERMGMLGEAAVDYALELAAIEASKTRNDAALVKQVCRDMSARGYPISEGDVGRQLAACASEARANFPQGPKS